MSLSPGVRCLLPLDEFPKHFFGIDGDECPFASGEDFVLFIQNFGGVDVLASVNADFPAFDV